MDYLGAGLLALASGLLALALSQHGAPLASILGPLALSSLFWALFAWRLRSAEEPFIPLSVLSNAVARNAALSGAFGLGAFVGLSVVMPVYFEGGLGLSADGSGLALIPMMVGTVVGATLSGRSMSHLAHYKTPAMIGLAFAGAAALILAWRLVDLSLWSLIALLTLASFGVGTMLPISTVCVQNSVEIRNLGSATAVMQFVRQIGCALIVALLGALVMGESASSDAALNIGGATLDSAARNIGGAAALEGLGASFHLVFIVIAICLGASLLFLVRMEEKPLRETPAAPRPAKP